MLKYNLNNINGINFDESNVKKMYYNGSVVYQKITDTPPTPIEAKLTATYTGGTTYYAECDSTSSVTSATTDSATTGYEHRAMTNAVIGDCVTSIGSFAFSGCTNLASVTMPNTITRIYNSVFRGCSSLTGVTIPDSVTSIGQYAFYQCTSLTSLTIGSSVTSIGQFAFHYCSGLTSLEIPSGVTSIGAQAFRDCTSLTSITVNATTPPTLEELAFQDTNNCPIYVPCESVDAYKAATNWSTLASRIQGIPPCQPTFQGKWLATYTGGTASSAECDSTSAITNNEIAKANIVSLEIGDCVTTFGGNGIFASAQTLTSLSIGNSVTSIAYTAFQGCSGLTSVSIGSGVTSIGERAFNNCVSLTSITIPDSVTSIGANAFNNCDSATSVTIGSGVTSIGDRAFSYMDSIASITINAIVPPTIVGDSRNGGTFKNTNCPIYVPAATVETYKSASGWSTYASRIVAIP